MILVAYRLKESILFTGKSNKVFLIYAVVIPAKVVLQGWQILLTTKTRNDITKQWHHTATSNTNNLLYKMSQHHVKILISSRGI